MLTSLFLSVPDHSAEEEDSQGETRQLREEVTTAAACLLYRLCEMVKYCTAEEGVDLRKLLRLLSTEPETPAFYEAILRQIFHRIIGAKMAAAAASSSSSFSSSSSLLTISGESCSRATTPTMTPKETIALFQQFSVMNFTLQHNNCLAQFIRNNFSEEFKYYIDLKRIRRMIPAKYPIYSAMIALIQRVSDGVFKAGP